MLSAQTTESAYPDPRYGLGIAPQDSFFELFQVRRVLN